MSTLSKLSEIPEFSKDYVSISNESELLRKINKVIKDGAAKFHIVTDFDLTLTRFFMENGQKGLTSWDMFWKCPSIPEQCIQRNLDLVNIYRPLEQDASISPTQKAKLMKEWAEAAQENAVNVGTFPRQELENLAREMAAKAFRKGVKETISWSQKHQVPTLIFSAGQGDTVDCLLRAANIYTPNVKVISNYLELNEDDNITGLRGELIHTENKNENAIKETDYYENVKQRSNVLVIGDNIGDAGMADGLEPCDVVIKVGLNGRGDIDKNMPEYHANFDIVLRGDPSFEIINSILKLIVQ